MTLESDPARAAGHPRTALSSGDAGPRKLGTAGGRAHTRWAWQLATFFGIGYLKPGPGTWASAVTVLLWGTLAGRLAEPWSWMLATALAALATILGTLAAARVVIESGLADPSFVVLDEVAGQMIALIALPLRWKYLFLSLILFRVMDIVKPPPLRRLEKLPLGAGVMLDDVGAGIYALLLGQGALHFHWL